MNEQHQKHLRTLNRDYWLHTPSLNGWFTLKREMQSYAALMTVCTVGAAFLFPPMVVPMLWLSAAIVPALFGIRLREIRRDMKKISTVALPICGENDETVTITGPSRAVNIVRNTHVMVNRLTEPAIGAHKVPDEVLNKLAPYFNDCVAAATELEARIDGKTVDKFPLTRVRRKYDQDNFTGPLRHEIKPLLTREGAEKKLVADRIADATVIAAQVQDGLSQPLNVRRIKLKVAA